MKSFKFKEDADLVHVLTQISKIKIPPNNNIKNVCLYEIFTLALAMYLNFHLEGQRQTKNRQTY